MRRRSVEQGVRRLTASPWRRCAPAALGLSLLLTAHFSAAQADPLVLQPASPHPSEAAPTIPASPLPFPPQETPEASAARVRSASGDVQPLAPAATNCLATALDRPGDLTLRNSSLDDALFAISELWDINVVVGEVKGSVNGVFKNAKLREILDSILLSNGYGYRPVGDSLVISPIDEVGRINPFFQSATIPVYAADIDEVVEGAKLLSTPQGQVQAMKSARSLLVLDFPDRVQMIRDFVTTIDGVSKRSLGDSRAGLGQPLEVGHFRTQYIAAKAAEEALVAVLSKDGRVGVLEKEDRLVITDYAENLDMVAKVLSKIDRPRPQVRIKALIYDLSLQDIEELGIRWAALADIAGDATVGLGVDPITKTPSLTATDDTLPEVADATIGLFAFTPDFDIAAVAHALQSSKDGRLLADPHIAVLENEEAVFQSVTEIPIQQLTQTQQGGQIGTTAFREAGITLRVRPKIAADGTIRMEVTPEFSRFAGTSEDGQPIIDRRTASTTLSVANRQTVVIGGLRQRADVGNFNGIPYLKDMRYVGKLFRYRSTDVRESELVVFIMPEIIGPADRPDRREQLVADTTQFRLDEIPEAEGCPPCCDEYCEPVQDVPAADSQVVPDESILPVPAAGASATPTTPSKAAGSQAPHPEPAEAAAPSSEFNLTSRDPGIRELIAQGRMRRLPAVEGGESASASAVPPQMGSQMFAGPPTVASRPRPDYDRRFRAAAGSSPYRQRTTDDRLPPQPAEAEKEEGFWNRIMRF